MNTHDNLIVDQFTRQAITFARIHEHSSDEAMRMTLDLLELDKTDQVLDVACGPGLTACTFAPPAGHVTGIDLTPAMLDQAAKRASAAGVSNVTWQIGDVSAMPFNDASFSVVFCRYAFHHFNNPRRVLGEMARVCAPGGRVVVADVYVESRLQGRLFDLIETWRDPSHVRAMTLDEMNDAFDEAGLNRDQQCIYRLEMELEAQLRASFPNAGDDRKIRAAMAADVGRNESGFQPRRQGDEIRFSYPVVVIRGGK